MPQGIITNIDFNFANTSGAKHTATVRGTSQGYAFDWEGGLIPSNAFSGELGDTINVANEQLSNFLNKFTVTEVKESSNSIAKKLEFNLQDNLSLTLDSIIVVLRGKEVGPLGEEDFLGNIYNWTELPDEIKYSTKYSQSEDSQGNITGSPDFESYVERGNLGNGNYQAPEWRSEKRTLVLGQIFNIVELEDSKGEMWTKAYINKERKPFLETPYKNPPIFINYNYPVLSDPEEDRGSWQDSRIKYGFTLKEFTEGLAEIGITFEGIPIEEEILIEESGTLSDILSSIASKLGYFWYVDPIVEKIVFMDSLTVDTFPVTSYVDTTETDIISADYNEEIYRDAPVISYSTVIQQEKREQRQRTQKERKLKKQFKLLKLKDKIKNQLEYLSGIYYLMWNKGMMTADYFDKLWFFAMHYSDAFRTGIKELEYNDELEQVQGDSPWILKERWDAWKAIPLNERGSNATPETNKIKLAYDIVREFLEMSDDENANMPVFKYAYRMEKKDGKLRKKGVALPSTDVWYDFVKNYMDSGLGGLYMSGAISNYRKDRIVFDQQDYKIIGIFRHDALLDDIQELAPLAQFLRKYIGGTSTDFDKVEDFARVLFNSPQSSGESEGWDSSWSKDRYYAFAVKNVEKIYQDVQDQGLINLFDDRIGSRIVETTKTQGRWLLFKDKQGILDYVDESRDLYEKRKNDLDLDNKKYIAIPYTRLRHPLNSEKYKNKDDDFTPTEENYDDLDLNKEERRILLAYPEFGGDGGGGEGGEGLSSILAETDKFYLDKVQAETLLELEAFRRNRSARMSIKPKATSNREIFGLFLPSTFSPEITSIRISFGKSGIKSSIQESTQKVLPIDQNIIITQTNLAKTSTNALSKANAAKRNVLGL